MTRVSRRTTPIILSSTGAAESRHGVMLQWRRVIARRIQYGDSIEEIAQSMKLNAEDVRNVAFELDQIMASDLLSDVTRRRQQESAKLDSDEERLRRAMDGALGIGPDGRQRKGAKVNIIGAAVLAKQILAIMARRASLLGLDATTKLDVTLYLRQYAEQHGLNVDEVLSEAQQVIRGH